ncbi:hypothetical protein [Algibacter sp. 2305UL17-15]|uniref:hypothetical protein n=1 Tax=Algibacter sp. 2305UL17-15 TaxID=3231268 RepID=UPI00345A4BD9
MKNIRTSKISRIIACYLSIQLILTSIHPSNLFALTGGPSQPEFNSFTPIGTSDMVNLSTGDFNYNIPIMDVGGYPLNLAYNSGITMDQEASWVGLGWNLNVGQIARNVRGIPDDFNGDEIRYENDMRDNVTVGTNLRLQPGFFGEDIPLDIGLGLGIEYNNYEGISFKPSFGISYNISDNVTVGMNVSSTTAEGATVTPNISLSKKSDVTEDIMVHTATGNIGVGFNSRKGLENMSLSLSGRKNEANNWKSNTNGTEEYNEGGYKGGGGIGGGISFNDQSYTPTKRAGMENSNFSFSAGLGITVFGTDFQPRVSGYGSYQGLRASEKDKNVQAFGYEHTEANEGLNGILDFNREKDKSYSKNTTVLPITNYTYDIYAIYGQGAGGQFRPFRSQTSYVYDQTINDYGNGGSFGLEGDVGNLVHIGFDIKVNPSTSYTGKWKNKNYALPKFIETEGDQNPITYEPVYFQTIGELGLDPQPELYNTQLHSNRAIKIGLGGGRYNRKALPEFSVKSINDGTNGSVNGTATYLSSNISSKIKRTERRNRNQSIQKIIKEEAEFDEFIDFRETDNFAQNHHTAGIKVLKPDGSTYVYGATAYNTKKVEATFDVSGSNDVNCATGIVGDIGSNGNTLKHSDHFLNRITTPAYAHTYLISSVLSSDYEDVDNNGPSLNDLGAYTLFSYKQHEEDFKWRVPYNTDEASYNEGLKSKYHDQKGNYIYGEKELVYIDKIETKTHVAVFKLINREDGRGARGETSNEVTSPGFQKAIDKIYLFSRPEFEPFRELFNGNIDDNDPVFALLEKEAIKVAHFDYNYSLCPGVPNNLEGGGKLTLERVYFTYRGSNMGRYTPYTFNYDNLNPNRNPEYNLKGYDVWGNYKVNDVLSGCDANDPITAAEFPYTDQDKTTADKNARAWTLASIDLPSGGKLSFETEADDYQYVQNRKVMQMFNVSGAGNTVAPNETDLNNAVLYNGNNHAKFLYIKISDDTNTVVTSQNLIDDYIGDQIGEAIQFRMLLNMTKKSWQYDYVTGYFKLDNTVNNGYNVIKITNASDATKNGTYATLPLQELKKEGGFINSDALVNPIAKSGWYFARSYLNREAYSLGGDSNNTDFASIVGDLVSSLGSVFEIFSGPNGKLQDKGCARIFNPEKSWVRLLNPTKRKLGGGLRVSKIEMHDNWDAMTSNLGNPLYKQFYGQEYNYNNEDGTTSGVATYEPASSKENPFIEPIYDTSETARDKLTAPKESNYTEKPLGESFYPSPTVTYARVEVKNLERKRTDNGTTVVLKKHATGKVVNEFYTSFNFPTITNYTDIGPTYVDNASGLSSILNISVRNHITLSQGFVVETNDMNGKMKSQRVYADGQSTAISGVDYNYSTNDDDTLNNILPTINEKGEISDNKTLGIHYDVVNDFRESYSKSETFGVNTNVTAMLIGIFPNIVVLPVPQYAFHENILRTAVTTKVIHKTGILKEKVAYDVGAQVSTENVAWDANTGQVLLTKTVNEYDNAYYNFMYPAYWYYKGMDRASNNLGLSGFLEPTTDNEVMFNVKASNTNTYLSGNLPFYPGDILETRNNNNNNNNMDSQKLWVVEIEDSKVKLMDAEGHVINHECTPYVKGNLEFKIIRSGYKNTQMASMSSVTSMLNPIDLNNDNLYNNINYISFNSDISIGLDNPKVINSSAVRYNETWKPQDQLGLPRLTPAVEAKLDEALQLSPTPFTNPIPAISYGFNPYLYNVLGEWRAVESYAYLTGRTSDIPTNENPVLKSNGYFENFIPFYVNSGGVWDIINVSGVPQSLNKWTSASTVTQYSPYGAELENKDALGRYSSALYGYGYTLPTAVASNSKFNEIAFDSFEDGAYSAPLNATSAVIDEINYDTEEVTYFNRDHFSINTFNGDTQGNGNVITTESHTGRSSYKLSGDQVRVTKGLTPYNYVIQDYPCYESDNQEVIDTITVTRVPSSLPPNDSGDDGRIYTLKGHSFTPVVWNFLIEGKPYDIVYLHCEFENSVTDNFSESYTEIVLDDNNMEGSLLSTANLSTTSLHMVRSSYLKVKLDANGEASFLVKSRVYNGGGANNPELVARSTLRFFDALGRDKNVNSVHGFINEYSNLN